MMTFDTAKVVAFYAIVTLVVLAVLVLLFGAEGVGHFITDTLLPLIIPAEGAR